MGKARSRCREPRDTPRRQNLAHGHPAAAEFDADTVRQNGTGIVDKTRIKLTWEKIGLIHLSKKRKNEEIRLILLSLILFFGLYICVAVLTINYV